MSCANKEDKHRKSEMVLFRYLTANADAGPDGSEIAPRRKRGQQKVCLGNGLDSRHPFPPLDFLRFVV